VNAKTKRISQSLIYDFDKYPIVEGQSFYSDKGIFYQDLDGERCAIIKIANIDSSITENISEEQFESLKGYFLIVKYDGLDIYYQYYVSPTDGSLIEIDSTTRMSAGVYHEPSINIDDINETVTVEACCVNLYNNSTFDGTIHRYQLEARTWDWTDLVNENETYYVVASYKEDLSGNPYAELELISDVSLITESDILPVYTLSRTANSVYYLG
jgi:hypothetical protein